MGASDRSLVPWAGQFFFHHEGTKGTKKMCKSDAGVRVLFEGFRLQMAVAAQRELRHPVRILSRALNSIF
jgi:hypothetical protein